MAKKDNPPKIRSGLAERQSPLWTAIKEIPGVLGRTLLKDRIALFLALCSIALSITFFTLLHAIAPNNHGDRAPISDVLNYAKNNEIATATILDHDARVVATLDNGQVVNASYPASGAQTQQILTALDNGGAVVTVDQQAHKARWAILVQFLIPILLLVCLFALFMRFGDDGGAGGIAGFSKFTGKGKKKGKGSLDTVTFADVAGAGDAVAELMEIRDYLANPTKYTDLGAAAPKGVLLVGPPGTGKTLLAKAVAGEADAAFFSLSGSDFVESLVGVGAARVRDLFRKARATAPSIIFIDEFDAAGRKRGAGVGQGNDEREQTLNALLVEMDGFGGDGGLVVMGATNRPDILDPALLRPGRFDRQVTIDNPDVHGRLEILRLHGRKRPLLPDVSLEEIARLTPGFSGAELANVINEAALLTVRDGRREIDQETLEEAIERVVAGPASKHVLTEKERWLISIHEASHAVTTEATGQITAARKISIVARGRSLGTAAHMLTDRDLKIMQAPDMERQLVAILAGAAGERIEFGGLSTGVNDDLHEATALARGMVTSYGMSDAFGSVTIGEKPGEVFLGASLQNLGQIGPETLNKIDREVERIVHEAEHKATAILRANWPTVREVATSLLEHETLSGVALDALLSPVGHVNLNEIPGRNGDGAPSPHREERVDDPDREPPGQPGGAPS